MTVFVARAMPCEELVIVPLTQMNDPENPRG